MSKDYDLYEPTKYWDPFIERDDLSPDDQLTRSVFPTEREEVRDRSA